MTGGDSSEAIRQLMKDYNAQSMTRSEFVLLRRTVLDQFDRECNGEKAAASGAVPARQLTDDDTQPYPRG